MTEAYVTLATNDRYALGALVLAQSLRRVETTRQLCILITPGVTDTLRCQLSSTFDSVVDVDVMDSNDSAHLALLKRPELGVTFTKLHCWTLVQYTKCVFLDADILAVQNADELFEKPELSAVSDIGWPDCFNSGVFVFVPSPETYSKLLQHAEQTGSFDGGDQGLLNTYFTNWTRLSFVYNMVASVTYTYLPAYKQYGSDVKFVHFLGASKPWEQTYHTESGTVVSQPGQEHISSHLNTWWNIYSTSVKPGIPETVSTASSTEVTSPVHECKHSQEAHETEPHIYHTQSTHTEHTPEHSPIYHDHHHQQVMTSVEETKPAYESHGWVDSSHTNVDTRTDYVDNHGNHVDSHVDSHIETHEGAHMGYVETRESYVDTSLVTHQEFTKEQRPQLVDRDTQTVDLEFSPSIPENTCEIHHRETQVTPHETTPSPSPSAANDSRLEGERHEDTVTEHVSDTRQLTDSPSSDHNGAYQISLTSEHTVKTTLDPIPESTGSSTTLIPQSNHIPTLPDHQPSHPRNKVPELKHTSEGTTQTEEPDERKQPVLWAGKRARVPLPPTFDASFVPLINPRNPSPFSGYRPASAVSTKRPLSELSDQLTGLNVSSASIEEDRRRWEEGVPDFRGKDSFDNILAHINSKLNSSN